MVLNLRLQAGAKMSEKNSLKQKNSLLETVKSSGLIVGQRVEGTEETPQLKLNYDKKENIFIRFILWRYWQYIKFCLGWELCKWFYTDRSRVKRVYTQADAQYRAKPEDLYLWNVRNKEIKWSLWRIY